MTKDPNPSGLCMCGCGQPTKPAHQTDTKYGKVRGKPQKFVVGHSARKPNNYAVDEETGCWNWLGSKNSLGYGLTSEDGRRQFAHRVLWSRAYGPIPSGMFVCHHCDNPSCCNPDHMFLGTANDNNKDAAAKGRTARGIRNGSVKLTHDDVRSIRQRFDEGETQASIARDYSDICFQNIWYIVHRLTWKDIPNLACEVST